MMVPDKKGVLALSAGKPIFLTYQLFRSISKVLYLFTDCVGFYHRNENNNSPNKPTLSDLPAKFKPYQILIQKFP